MEARPADPAHPAPPPARVVRETLLEYAERGVFRGFDHRLRDEPTQGATFRFFWLGPHPFHLTLDSEGETLTAERLLPSVDEHPDVRTDLERFIEERVGGQAESDADDDSSGHLPPHRRVDPEKASVALVSGRGRGREEDQGEDLDLVLSIRNGHHEYAVRKLLNLINEIWVRLQDRHQRYLWEEFQAPME